MKLRYVIPLDSGCWYCDICNASVAPVVYFDYDKFGNRLDSGSVEPDSKYWHGVKKVAYCSPECSLNGHLT